MKNSKDNKYFKLAVTLFITGALLILFYHIVVNFKSFSEGVDAVRRIFSPFVYGLIMAYLLCPIYNLVVRKTYHLSCKKIKNKKRALALARTLGSIVALIVLIGVIAGFLALLVPQLIDSVFGLFKDLPGRFEILTDWVNSLTKHIKDPQTAKAINSLVDKGQTNLLEWAENKFLPSLGIYMNKISQGLILTVKALINFFVGIIVCVYFLNSKEVFKAQSKKIILATTKKEVSDEIFNFANFTNRTFGGFINGKIIDSVIIGILCFIAMKVIHLPYPILISTIIGVTNIIPFFGPFIGAIPCSIIIALVSPVQAVYFLIMIFVLQQLDGNVIGPAILGETTGLASFWVMFSIIVGGGLFGFVGMILGVPVFAVIYYYIGRAIARKLDNKGMPTETWDYQDFNKYDIDRKEVQ